MPNWRQRRGTIVIACVIVGAAVAVFVGALLLNPKITRYVEGDAFRAELEKETAKGLHFPSAQFAPIKRNGPLSAESSSFSASDGWKAMRSLDARGITAKFNPGGVFLRRWQLDDVHIQRGEVAVQVYEPRPEPSPPKPWYAKYFLPERVYLKHVETETANVTWRFRGKRAGIFDTRLLITPHGRDFEYRAREGSFRMEPFPEMRVDQIDLLITRKLFTLYNMDLGPKASADGQVHAEGKAGTAPDDRGVDVRCTMDRVPVDAWVPLAWRDHVDGLATTKIHWTGKDTKLESANGEAECRIDDGRIYDLPFLENVATLTNDKSLQRLKLDAFRFELEWRYPNIDVKRFLMEEHGKFRAEGEMFLHEKSLDGTIELGVAPALLAFLTAPVVKEVFPREQNGYLWTTVHLSGTIKNPRVDLSTRIMDALKAHPSAALQLFFQELGVSLRHAFGEE